MRLPLMLLAVLRVWGGYAQSSKLDTAFVFFNVRMLLLTDAYEMSMRPKEEVQGFIDGTWRYGYHLVASEGYPSNYIFCAMTNQVIMEPQVSDTAGVRIRLNHRLNTKFMVAINTTTNQMYKLEGFKCLDDIAFRMDVLKYVPSAKEKRYIIRKRRFPAHFVIQSP